MRIDLLNACGAAELVLEELEDLPSQLIELDRDGLWDLVGIFGEKDTGRI